MKENQRFKNAIRINFSILITSISVRLTIILVFSISLISSFWPRVSAVLFNSDVRNVSKEDSSFFFLISLSVIVLLFMVLLIARVGAQVGFEKGNRVTELILTSITRTQLYIAHIISSFEVLVISFIIIFSPMVAAYFINKPMLTVNLRFLTLPMFEFIGLHTIMVSLVLVILAVTIASIVKRGEDTGPCMLFILLPVIISHIYFVITNGLYKGVLFVLNYIPIFSLIPGIGACINNKISLWMGITILISDILFICITYVFGNKFFNSNIATY